MLTKGFLLSLSSHQTHLLSFAGRVRKLVRDGRESFLPTSIRNYHYFRKLAQRWRLRFAPTRPGFESDWLENRTQRKNAFSENLPFYFVRCLRTLKQQKQKHHHFRIKGIFAITFFSSFAFALFFFVMLCKKMPGSGFSLLCEKLIN